MKNYILHLFFLIFGYFPLVCQEKFHFKHSESNVIMHETIIESAIENKTIGFIYFVHFPFSIYVLHTFFIYPEWREKGYGTKLLAFATCYLKKLGARFIFIQPGPFDIKNGEFENIKNGKARDVKIKKLINLYTSVGFKKVNRFISTLSKFIYYCAKIEENPDHLMIS